jgi:hypothetical protein
MIVEWSRWGDIERRWFHEMPRKQEPETQTEDSRVTPSSMPNVGFDHAKPILNIYCFIREDYGADGISFLPRLLELS